MQFLIALAEENPQGRISWADFIPTGIEAIQTFLQRNKNLAKQQSAQKTIDKDTIRVIF